jgi:hypothetical protein
MTADTDADVILHHMWPNEAENNDSVMMLWLLGPDGA